MKVSLNWVKEFTDVKLTVDELVEKIGAQLGAVEEVIDLGKKYEGIVIAKVVTCEKHPNADKLQVCTIDDGGITPGVKRGKDGLVQVVCGAPNVAAGMLVAWLPPGTVVPSSYDKEAFKLEAREIRGVVSNGMLASPSELAIGDDHSGILAIDDAKPGDSFSKVYGLDDYIIDIENKMFTHRPDLFGVLGVAREIAGIQHIAFHTKLWDWNRLAKPPLKAELLPLQVKNELPKLVPRFMAQVIQGVEVKPSSSKEESRLSKLGIKSINNVVDVTNWAMMLTGQPMHAYDYDKVKALSGDQATIVIRHPKPDEKIKLLNGKIIEPRPEAIVIATDKELIGIGGVMGGADTEVDENTKNIILECANFDMYSIRRTAMEHGLFTEAVTRFTKGQSPLQNGRVMLLAVNSIVGEEAGGDLIGEFIDIKDNIRPLVAVHVTQDFINARLGLELGIKEMAKLLENVEFDVAINGPTLAVTPPFWRTDIEIPEDIVEEIGRLYGFDNLPLELPKRDLTPAPKNPMLELKDEIRSILSSAGANEMLSYSFVHGKLLENMGQDKDMAFQLSNALSPDLQYYRMSMTPSLLEKVHPNIKAGHGEFALFELGKVHMKGLQDVDQPELPGEEERIALVFVADDKTAKQKYGRAPYYQALKYLDELLDSLHIPYRIERFEHAPSQEEGRQLIAPFDPERTGFVYVGDTWIGCVAELKKGVCNALKLPAHTAVFELDTLRLLRHHTLVGHYLPLSRFPKVEQDISLRVSSDLTYGELYTYLERSINNIKPRQTTTTLEPLDIYQKESDKKHKQITLRLTIASYERTLTDKEVNSLLDETAKAAEKKFGATRL